MERVGVDIGGTFTDWVTIDAEGKMSVTKVPSTADAYKGVFDAAKGSGVDVENLLSFDHGTTLGTNALIQRSLPRIAMVTTKGFKGLMTEAARGTKEDVWDMYDDSPKPTIVPPRDRLEVDERIDYSGKVRKKLNEDEARKAVNIIKRRGIKTIAICFINSYTNDVNERRMEEIVLEEYPEALVSTSSGVCPRIMENERFTTTILNVGLIPIVGDYITVLEEGMRERKYKNDILIAQSGGGLMGTEAARDVPVRTANSGPAAGAVAVQEIGRLAGYDNVIGVDMGGTSTDVSVVLDGQLLTVPAWHVEWGHVIMFPAVDVTTVGAGGGSVAWLDSGGRLRNGPQSVGANPGPACYMKGGDQPTNTDANLVIGALDPERFLGGQMTVSKELSEKVVNEKIGRVLDVDTAHAADSVLQVAEANMADAIRLATLRKGLDPRDFVLLAFGGAGPLHAARLAKELGIPKAIAPLTPGLTSALGCLLADIRHDMGISVFFNDATVVDIDVLRQHFGEFEKQLLERLNRENIPPDRQRLERTLDMCYTGQWRVLPIRVDGDLTREALAEAVESYHQLHEREHTFALRDRKVEIHGVNVTAVGITNKPAFEPVKEKGTAAQAHIGARGVFWRETGDWTETNLYAREKLLPGANIEGPAIIEQLDSTILIPPDMTAIIDEQLNIVINTHY